MSRAASQDRNREQNEQPAKLQIPPTVSKIAQRNRNRKIGHGDQHVGYDMQDH